MKLTTIQIIFIVQSVLILILFLVIVFKKNPDPTIVDYNKIKAQIQESINTLKSEFDSLSEENIILYRKMDSLKYQIPNNKKSLDKINREIKRLNEKVVEYSVDNISSNVLQHDGYIKDLSKFIS